MINCSLAMVICGGLFGVCLEQEFVLANEAN